eukprot:COSAG05_NODE_192_length_14608_cov_6.266386_11_plen_100_part_00
MICFCTRFSVHCALSHKSNLPHPGPNEDGKAALKQALSEGQGMAVDGHPGAVEVFMQKGDALLFTDAVAHGSARRINEGFRCERTHLVSILIGSRRIRA